MGKIGRKGKNGPSGKKGKTMQNQLVNKLKNARKVVAITGAGISAESGMFYFFSFLEKQNFE